MCFLSSKRTVSLILTLAILLTGAVLCGLTASAAEFILNHEEAHGSDYTDRPALAAALDEIFAGDIDMYRDYKCTDAKEKFAPLGSSDLTEKNQYYITCPANEKVISGWQCYIYANAVYNKLFGEFVYHGSHDFLHSEVVIGGGAKTVSYEMFKEADVRCGAYIRTTANKDGSYNGSYAHSLIVLCYDAETITYVDGNSNGRGLVRINTRTWEDFNKVTLTGKNRRVNHIVQPTAEVYDRMYPAPAEEEALRTGDLNDNGDIDAVDYMMLKRAVLGSYHLCAAQKIAADVNCDDRVNAADYAMVKRHVLGTYEIVGKTE